MVYDLETTGISISNEKLVTFGVLKKTVDNGFEHRIFHTKPQREQGNEPKEMVDPDQEKQVIEKFLNFISDINPDSPVYTYNGDTFDWPFLIARAYELFDDYGDTVDKLFQMKENRSHDLIKSHGTYPSGAVKKLEQVLSEHGIEHSGGVGGAKVPEYFAKGRLDEIIEYSREDVLTTAALVEQINGRSPESVLKQRERLNV